MKTAVPHFAVRTAIRKGWYQDTKKYGNKLVVFFLIGHSENAEHEEYVRQEQEKYGDIIMAKMEDTYRGVTKKVVMGMAFVYNYCKNALYVVHLDDDTYFSPIRFMRIIYPKVEQQKKSPKSVIQGYTDQVHCASMYYHPRPFRRRRLWKVTLDQWASESYPNYCSGMGWGMPINVHRKTFELTRKIDFSQIYNIDDTILTGIIRAQVPYGLLNYGYIMWHTNNKSNQTAEKLYAKYKHGKYQVSELQWRRRR